ncbi:glycoside hydrolase family 71/99-like protein [Pedobacter faecalis]|uniref:glycoside hydrolase family 71/99-like protein n=1 Tax=Pedobacter faecalis TaxID=3041495 RepID=UPI00254FDFAD|nr:glycoside hydrolase family 71/99-like protein [Pedobacter sp. ELA7]
MKQNVVVVALLLVVSLPYGMVQAQSRHGKAGLFKSYSRLVMAGYQGWHNAEADGAGRGWYHYTRQGKFEPGFTNVDLWPEVGELKRTYQTNFKHADGSPAFVHSAYDSSTVDTHFKWMKDYGVDGVFMQRFVVEIKEKRGRHHFNRVLQNALGASQKYGRAISVMYDLSGCQGMVDMQVLIDDWKNLVDSMKITRQGKKQTYLFHRGKPLVVIWGVGFNDKRKYSIEDVASVVDFLKNDPVYGGCSVMLGVPTYWREMRDDTENNPLLHELIRKADIVHPWTIGRYGDEAGYERYAGVQREDMAWCKANGLDYTAVVFPGFSWHNMNSSAPSDQIPRERGTFFWKQIEGAVRQGAQSIYIAMFDEIDEATAIFKVSKNPPVGASTFVSFEADIPSDYYLYLSGHAGKMLRRELPFRATPPPPIR